MHYEGDIYRPPSEARSLIVQVTVGCTHNGCTFCPSYKAKKFYLKPFDIVLADLQEARGRYRSVNRIFFADGDALCMTTAKFRKLLDTSRGLFPECSRIGTYSRAAQILKKSDSELAELRAAGLGIIYIGAESGSDEVLRRVNKGETAEDIIASVHKAERAGIETSVTFISGLGGVELMEEHAVRTGEMISAMGASYVGLLTLLLSREAPIYQEVHSGKFKQLSPVETMKELEIILDRTECERDTVFRANHPSNWLILKGVLPRDKALLLGQVRSAIAAPEMLRSHSQRRL